MKKWVSVTLSEIFNIARGGSPRPIQNFITDDPNGINWIMIGDASDGSKYITNTKKRIRKEGVSKSRMVHPGDFLLTNSMSFGHPYIMRTAGCIHDGWLVLSPKGKDIHPDYFYYLLGSDTVYREFCRRASGTTVKNLNIDLVSGVKILLPSLEEQRRIAAILDKADAVRRKRREAIRLTEELLRSQFLEMFGDPVINSKGWAISSEHLILEFGATIKSLSEVADVIDCKHRTPIYIETGYPVVRPRDVREKGIQLHKCLKTSQEEYVDLTDKRQPQKDDIVYSPKRYIWCCQLSGYRR